MAAPRITDVIVQYDGSSDFAEWIKKLELVAKLKKVDELENFLPLFLVGDAFAVYDALSDDAKSDYDKLRTALTKAFSLNPFSAFDRLITRRYVPGESVDVYLSDLRRLIGLIGNTEDLLKCAFVSGLPTRIKMQLKAASALESRSQMWLREQGQSILKNTSTSLLPQCRGLQRNCQLRSRSATIAVKLGISRDFALHGSLEDAASCADRKVISSLNARGKLGQKTNSGEH